MNIKTITSLPILPIEPKSKIDGETRAQSTTDRDANGRQEQAEGELKRHLNDDEFNEALKTLAENPGFKANNLTVRVETHEDHRVVLVVDPQGQIVRRLSEAQLWLATRNKDRQTGKILDKAM